MHDRAEDRTGQATQGKSVFEIVFRACSRTVSKIDRDVIVAVGTLMFVHGARRACPNSCRDRCRRSMHMNRQGLARCISPKRCPTNVAKAWRGYLARLSSSRVMARNPVCVVRGTKVIGAVRDPRRASLSKMRCRLPPSEKFGAISYGITPQSQYRSERRCRRGYVRLRLTSAAGAVNCCVTAPAVSSMSSIWMNSFDEGLAGQVRIL